MKTLGQQKLAAYLPPEGGWEAVVAFAKKVYEAAQKHPLIRASARPYPGRVSRWKHGTVTPGESNRVLIQMATGGKLRRAPGGWTVEGGEIQPGDWDREAP